jgi:hypothetical protein
MTPQKLRYYIQAMERIKSKERLIMMDSLQYPTLEIKEKKKKHKEVYRQAFPENFEERILKTTDLELF